MEPFVYLERYRVVICKKCGFACVSNEVPTHLRIRHRDITPTNRNKAAKNIERIPGIIKSQSELADFQFPPLTASPIPFLSPPQPDGLKCRKCPYIARQVQKIQAHCRDCQEWHNTQGRGRPKQRGIESPPDLPWREGVLCQRFFPSRAASRLFEVGRKMAGCKSTGKPASLTSAGQSTHPASLTLETREHLQGVLDRESKYMEAENQPRVYSKALGDDSFAATSLWLERTRWPIAYKNVRRDILQAMTRLPACNRIDPSFNADFVLGQGPREGDADIVSLKHDEQKIACMLGAVDLTLDRCELTVQHTSRLLLCWLLSSKPGAYQPKPFALMTEENTRKKYRSLWKRFIAFILRAYLISATIREQELKVHLFPELVRQLKCLWEHKAWDFIDTTRRKWRDTNKISHKGGALISLDPKEEQPGSSICDEMSWRDSHASTPDVDSESDAEDSEGEDEDFQEDESDNEASESIADPTMEDAREETQHYADENFESSAPDIAPTLDEFLELLFQLSLTLSTENFIDGQPGSTLLIHFSGILGFSADCRQFRLARQYCPHLSGLIYVQRLIFLESALPLSSYVTIGIEQRPRIQQLERLNKVRERYMVAGSPTPLAELHSLRNFGHRVARTEPPTFFLHWSDDGDRVSWGDDSSLSMQDFRGLADYFITRAEELCDELMYGFEPHFDLSKIKDDMTNTQPGYSFVMHPDNGFENIYKDLLVRACTSRTGKLAIQGQWNFKAITSYLRLMTRLEEMLGGGYLTACGQVPRLLELLSLAVENSPCATRGMFIWNGSVAYALQHHKAKRSTNQEFYVVRFLPIRLATVTLKYLTCIRRVGALLRREQFGQSSLGRSSLRGFLFFQSNGKAWTSTRLTALLKAASKKVWDREVNSRVYRQLAIGITEKHVREVYSPFNRYDDRSTDADRNVVFAWQSGHRPMQRAVTYGLDGAYPHQLQPSLLRAYEWASTRWHEFLHQASKKGAHVDEDPPASIKRSMTAESYKAATFISQIDVQSINGTKKRRNYTSGEKLCQAGESPPNHTPARHIYSTVRLEGFACILPEYHILVCLLCKAAVRPGGAIENHFRHVHHVKGETLKAIKQLHSGWTLGDPMNMAPLDDGSKVITELAAQWGYSCKSCIYMTISRKNALTHCAQHKPGISKTNAPAWKEVLLQTFMRGRYAQYWIVGDT
ncbi:hypothetical protein AUP68_10965 [Ilyonectria robusta]